MSLKMTAFLLFLLSIGCNSESNTSLLAGEGPKAMEKDLQPKALTCLFGLSQDWPDLKNSEDQSESAMIMIQDVRVAKDEVAVIRADGFYGVTGSHKGKKIKDINAQYIEGTEGAFGRSDISKFEILPLLVTYSDGGYSLRVNLSLTPKAPNRPLLLSFLAGRNTVDLEGNINLAASEEHNPGNIHLIVSCEKI